MARYRWLVVQTKSLCEQKTSRYIRQGGAEPYVPLFFDERLKRRRPLFVCYLFARFERHQHDEWLWSTIGVINVLGSIDAKEINALKRRETKNGVIKLPPPPHLEKGKPVKANAGLFENETGIVKGMLDHDRVAVLFKMMGKTLEIHYPSHQLRPASLTA